MRFIQRASPALSLAFGLMWLATAACQAESLDEGFSQPPNSARPQTWWHWMNGNLNREAITGDLEAMKKAGLGGAQIFNVNCGLPAGPVKFLSPEWLGLFHHAAAECDRLGLELSVHNCDGWSESAGPWVRPEDSMQKVVWSVTRVTGPTNLAAVLPAPPANVGCYRDIALLAYRTPPGDEATMAELAPKVSASAPWLEASDPRESGPGWLTLPLPAGGEPRVVTFEFARPFTCRAVTVTQGQAHGPAKAELRVSADGRDYRGVCALPVPGEGYSFVHNTTAGFGPVTGRFYQVVISQGVRERVAFKLDLLGGARVDRFEIKSGDAARPLWNVPSPFAVSPGEAIRAGQLLDLTARLQPDGRLEWHAPPGEWTLLRLGHTSTGKTNAQATKEGAGLECDKMNADAVRKHFDAMLGKVIAEVGPLAGKSFKTAHVDSWEALCANWTPTMLAEFRRRRGYDPLPYLPAMTGRVVESVEVSERFLWDLRRTIADLVSTNHFAVFREELHRRGLQFQAEAVGPNATTITVADPFQSKAQVDLPMGEFWAGRETAPDCKEAASSAHLHGKSIVPAEAFTAVIGNWTEHPFSLKATGDRAFCRGINRFVFHRFVHNPWPERKPGMTMGQYGINLEPTVTWWEFAPAWFEYLSRCQFLLQQGRAVADVLYYVGENATSRLEPLAELTPALPAGYDADGCGTDELLELLSVRGGRLVTPSGMSYRLLVLPNRQDMTPRVARKLSRLVQDGAVVVGPKPLKSPSLQDYPACDAEVQRLAQELWGDCDGRRVTEHAFGRGKVFWTSSLEPLLRSLHVEPDFQCQTNACVDFVHRRDGETDIYFVSNQTNAVLEARFAFRNLGRRPELWDPSTGERRDAKGFWMQDGRAIVPLRLEPRGSLFVVFRQPLDAWALGNGQNWDTYETLQPLNGPWQVSFDTAWGGPASAQFDPLVSWPERPEPGIKHYSGTAVYAQEFDRPSGGQRLFLDLGRVAVIAEVRLNGQRLGIAWKPAYRVELTPALQPGRNKLEVRVANLWPNRLIGDEQLPPDCEWRPRTSQGAAIAQWPEWLLQGKPSPAGRLTFAAWQHFTKDSPLLESGLLGPVTLQRLAPPAGSGK